MGLQEKIQREAKERIDNNTRLIVDRANSIAQEDRRNYDRDMARCERWPLYGAFMYFFESFSAE